MLAKFYLIFAVKNGKNWELLPLFKHRTWGLLQAFHWPKPLCPSGFARVRTWIFLVNIPVEKAVVKGKLSQYIIKLNHIFYYVRTSIFYILIFDEIYLFLYNTVEQLFWRVREEDQVTLFGAKMQGFFGLKIESHLSFFHVCSLFLK